MKKRTLVRGPRVDIKQNNIASEEKDSVLEIPVSAENEDETAEKNEAAENSAEMMAHDAPDMDEELKDDDPKDTEDSETEDESESGIATSNETKARERSYIEFRDVKKYYKMGEVTIKAADGIDFEIKKGEFAVIIGASGAGKTTVLNMLGGIDTSDSGEIFVDDVNVSSMTEKELIMYRRHDIGFVFQFYNLVNNLTARENVELAAQLSDAPKNIFDVMDSVGLSERMDNFPSQLSGGEQQRVAIARALVKNPKLLLCDEPTGALDYATGKMILAQLKKTCREENMTVVLITHNAALTPIADRVISMKSGRVVSSVINDSPVDVETIEW